MGKKVRFREFEVKVLSDHTRYGLYIPKYVVHEEGTEPDVLRSIAQRNGMHVREGGDGETLVGINVGNHHSFYVRATIRVTVQGKIVTPGYQRKKGY